MNAKKTKNEEGGTEGERERGEKKKWRKEICERNEE